MKFTKVMYSRSYEMSTPLGVIWEKIGLEAELGELEEPETQLEILKGIVEGFHKEHTHDAPPQQPPKKEDKKMKPDQTIRMQYATAVALNQKQEVEKFEMLYDFTIN